MRLKPGFLWPQWYHSRYRVSTACKILWREKYVANLQCKGFCDFVIRESSTQLPPHPSAGLQDWAVPLPLPGWLGCRCRTCTDWMTLRFNLWRFLGTSWKCSLFRVLDIPTATWTSKLETLQANCSPSSLCWWSHHGTLAMDPTGRPSHAP